MDWSEHSDQPHPADEIGEAAGVSISLIARARLDPSSSAYRSPPDNWQPVLARLARERMRQLAEFTEEMEMPKR